MSDQDQTCLQSPEQWALFVSAFIHELRTPIASLRMLADLLADAPQSHLGEPERRYLENLREVVQDIQGLVGDAAELSRLVSGREQTRSAEVALEPLIEEVERVVRPRAWEGGIAITHSLDPALPKHFRTDPDHLRRILTLLLGAIVGQARSEVFFRLDLEGTDLRAVLSSDGQPFSEAALHAALEPFSEAARTLRQRGGRSLALPLSRELVRALGGTLRVGNRGDRPTFDLSLPLAF
jgi:signal transduction histidine kinase